MATENRQHWIMYEHPLSERIRTFLRLDALFSRITYLNDCYDHPWKSRFIIGTINDIINVTSYVDIKQELIKELNRNDSTMGALEKNPNVNAQRLQQVHQSIKSMIFTLCSPENSLGNRLRNIELLELIRKRSNIPANDCDFDLPRYKHWLCCSTDNNHDLQGWVVELNVLRQAIELVLQLLRLSAKSTQETAINGFFQRNLKDKSALCQMVRVDLPAEAQWFPEISGGKHRLTIRFMLPANNNSRPLQATQDIAFKLFCCML